MRYYPINLDVRNKPAVVLGGGTIAARKIKELLLANAHVTVIAPALGRSLQSKVRKKIIVHQRRGYRAGDLRGYWLAIVATSDHALNRRIAQEARRRRVWVNVVDDPSLCDFTLPARLTRGELLITISTGGKAPALAKWLRKELTRTIGPEYQYLVTLLGKLRKQYAALPFKERARRFQKLLQKPLIEALKKGDRAQVKVWVERCFGGS